VKEQVELAGMQWNLDIAKMLSHALVCCFKTCRLAIDTSVALK